MPSELNQRADLLDRRDPLASRRHRYRLPADTVYLAGNSLGPVPEGAEELVQDALRSQWGQQGVRAWVDWMKVPAALGERIGTLIGAAPGQVMVSESASVQIFNMLVAAARLRPDRRVLISDCDHFPTDRFMAESAAELLGLRLRLVPPTELAEALREEGDDVAAVAFPAVDYRTGEVWDMAGLTRMAHEAGAVVLWDLSHAVGCLPVELDACEADLAVGCTYKYLSAGPGSPAFVYVARRHQDQLRQPLTGWLGHATPFATDGPYKPAPGVGRAVIGTPAMLSTLPLVAALDVFDDLSMAEVRAKSLSLTGFLMDAVDERLAELGVTVVTPREDLRRASHVALRHPDAYPLVRALEQRGVVADMRAPDIIRFGLNAMYTSHEDVLRAVEQLREAILAGEARDPRFERRSHFG